MGRNKFSIKKIIGKKFRKINEKEIMKNSSFNDSKCGKIRS